MPTPSLFNVLANAMLCGEQERDAVVARLTQVLGRKWRWVQPLSGRYIDRFALGTRPRRRDVVGFLRSDPGFIKASDKYGRRIEIVQWITGPQTMKPVDAAQAWPVPRIQTHGDLAEELGTTPSELGWFADLKRLGYKCPQRRLEHYHYRVVTKVNGSIRLIESPKPHLKQMQRQILTTILNKVPSHHAAHGFVKGRSIQTFAAPHTAQRVVLRMDLENFFPSFARARVQSFFRTVGYPETVADLLGGVATNSVPRKIWRDLIKQAGCGLSPQGLWSTQNLYARPHLPQGAPTSPSLANLCCYRLDCRLWGLAQSAGAAYTRYADDLAFSGGNRFEGGVERFAMQVAAILKDEGFTIQHRKTRIMRQSTQQHLAGLVINQRLNVRRSDFDMLKAILTNCARHTPESENRNAHSHFREYLQGKISFIESVHTRKGTHLRALFERINWA